MPYELYRMIHLASILVLFGGLVGLAGLYGLAERRNAESQSDSEWYARLRKKLLAIHGAAAFFVLLGGFGMLARLGLTDGFPAWVILKLVVWTLVSALLPVLMKRIKTKQVSWLLLSWGLFTLAIYSANIKF